MKWLIKILKMTSFILIKDKIFFFLKIQKMNHLLLAGVVRPAVAVGPPVVVRPHWKKKVLYET